MVKFSCFLASLHHHKSKKYPLQTPEAMQKTSQDQTQEPEGNGLGKSPISDTSNLQPFRSDRNSLIPHSTSFDALVPVDTGASSVSEERQECFSEPDPWLGTICLKRSKSMCAELDNGNGFSTVVDLENEAEKALSCIDIQERVSDDHKDYANASPGILSGMDDDDSGKHPLNGGVLTHEDLHPTLERANSFPNLIENARSESGSPLAEDVLVFVPRSKSSDNLHALFWNKQALLDKDAGVGNSSFLNVSAPLSLKSEQLHEVIKEGSVFSHRNGGTTTQVFDEVSISIQEAAIGDGAGDGYDSCGSSVHEHEIVESHPVGIEDMDNLHSVYQEADGLKEYPRHWWEGLSSKEFHHKRIENWISTISDDESKVEDFAPQETRQASTASPKLRSDVNEVGGGPAAVKTDPKAHQSTELARRHLSMLGPMSTIAQMSNCSLASIPQLGIFSGLRMVNLSGNAIARITPGVLPKGLRVLNLSRNNISIIEGLRDLTRLRVLDLSYNRIVRIGHGLASCSSLKELYLAGNKISEVEGLHRLLKLNILDIGYNKISTTKCLGQLAANYGSLQAINLEGNPAQKNVGDEQLKKALLSLLPHLIYINRRPVKAGSLKDLVPVRAARTASSSHQFERGVRSDRKVSRKSSHGGSGGHKSSSVSNSYNQATNKHSRSHYVQDAVNRSKVTLHQANLENRLVDLHLVKSQCNKSEGSLNKIVK